MTMAIRMHRITGDWTINDYVDNLDRRRELRIAIIDGVAWDIDDCERPTNKITLTSEDTLTAWGAGVEFLPDAGEVDRIGREHFVIRSDGGAA